MSAIWLATLPARAQLLRSLRATLDDAGFVEVETPVRIAAPANEPHIVPPPSGRAFLRASPELQMKQLVALGLPRIYQLGPCFRAGERGDRHNPEFTMLEWYRIGWDHLRLLDETVALVRAALALVGRDATPVTTTFRDLYWQHLRLDPLTADIDTLRSALGDVRIDPDGLGRDDWLDLLMTHRLQPLFGNEVLLAVHDWPASQAALARIRDGDPPVAERFELYLGPLELANGYHELCDAGEQRARFERDGSVRAQRRLPSIPMDAALLAALEQGLPACAGVALGVDRLLMALLGTPRIADVLAFDFARA